MTVYPAQTLWQPWATLVAAELKPLEFRSHCAPRRLWGEWIAIHAGVRKPRVTEMRALLVKLHGARWRETGLVRDRSIALLEGWVRQPEDLPLGSVLCLAVLGEPLRNAALAAQLGVAACDGFGSGSINDSFRHQHSNWGWPLSSVAPVEPFAPARGMQGWWHWTAPADLPAPVRRAPPSCQADIFTARAEVAA